jgi:hypothetical protein
MSRLITLGCSYTRYHWPTWADVVGRSFDQFENWGHAGIGNRAIFERLVEVLLFSNPSASDVVIVQWTHPHRFDQHNKDDAWHQGWIPKGHIHGYQRYEDDWIKDYWNEYSYIMHTGNFISAAKSLLEHQGCRWYFMSSQDLENDFLYSKDFEKYLEVYRSIDWLPPIGDWFEKSQHPTRWLKKKISPIHIRDIEDLHPTPIAHYYYADEFLKELLGITLDKEWIDGVEKTLDSIKYYKEIKSAFDRFGWDVFSCVKGL